MLALTEGMKMNAKGILIAGACSLLVASQASAASLERTPVDGTPGIVRIFVPTSQVGQYQALGYQVIDYAPSNEILQTYINVMCGTSDLEDEIAARFGVAPAQLCASGQAAMAEGQ